MQSLRGFPKSLNGLDWRSSWGVALPGVSPGLDSGGQATLFAFYRTAIGTGRGCTPKGQRPVWQASPRRAGGQRFRQHVNRTVKATSAVPLKRRGILKIINHKPKEAAACMSKTREWAPDKLLFDRLRAGARLSIDAPRSRLQPL